MSIEQLLLFLLLVALPLVERLIRTIRTRTKDASAERTRTVGEPAGAVSRRPQSSNDEIGTAADGRQTELPLPALPLPPQAVPHTMPEPLRPREGSLHVRREGKRGAATRLRAGGRSDSQRALAPVLGDGDLRRAIVMIAILGPCRALEPKDASQLNP